MSWWKKNKNPIRKEEFSIIQENQDACVLLLQNSFLKGIFSTTLTDISYNGIYFYAQDNEIGRYRLPLNVESNEVFELVKKIANYMLKPFSLSSPVLDVSFGNYRLNAVHPILARSDNKKVITFSIRCISPVLRIKQNDSSLAPLIIHDLLKAIVRSYQSVLISGQTGSGKTELQKYLLSFMNPQDRIILIEESYETHIKEIYKDMDVTSWIVDNKKDQLSSLIRLALRNNPDWLIVAETRGIEAYDMVQGTMTGHSAITTIHSESCEYSLKRITQLCKKSIDFDEVMLLNSMARHLKIGIHLEKIFDESTNHYKRRIFEICEYVPSSAGYDVNILFKINKNESLKESFQYGTITVDLKEHFIKNNISLDSIQQFIKKGGKHEKKEQ